MDEPTALEQLSDLDVGVFYVRAEMDGKAIKFATSVCAECYSLVPRASMNMHAEWHDSLAARVACSCAESTR